MPPRTARAPPVKNPAITIFEGKGEHPFVSVFEILKASWRFSCSQLSLLAISLFSLMFRRYQEREKKKKSHLLAL